LIPAFVSSPWYERRSLALGAASAESRRADINPCASVADLGKYTVDVQLAQAVEKMRTLGLRKPELLENRVEDAKLFSIGENGQTDDQKLQARLEALRM
jgi:hypothetical protein